MYKKLVVFGGLVLSLWAFHAKITHASGPTFGVRKTIVILFNFTGFPDQPLSLAQAKGLVFTDTNSVNSYYKEVSYNRLSLRGKNLPDGDVFGYYQLPTPTGTDCNFLQWAQDAKHLAEATGVDTTGYDQFIYLFTRPSQCPTMAGAADAIGGSNAYYVMSTAQVLPVGGLAHEVGHNLGLYHANRYDCVDSNNNPVAVSSNCTSVEYGDLYSIMGPTNEHNYYVSGYARGFLGWLMPADTYTLYGSEVVTVNPIENLTSNLKVLRIPRTRDAQGNVLDYYYVEYKQPFGFDDFTASDTVANGVQIRVGKDYFTGGSNTWVMNTRAETGYTPTFDTPLLEGFSFNDTTNGIKITTRSVSSSAVVLCIEINGTPCDSSPAPLVVYNVSGGTIQEGGAVTYQVKLASQPNASVSVALSGTTSLSQYKTGSPATTILNFTTSNWNTYQSVTVTATADSVHQGNRIEKLNLNLNSNDARFRGLQLRSMYVIDMN